MGAATIYELVIAVRGAAGSVPGETPSGERVFYLLSLLAIVVGVVLALAPSRTSVFPLAPAAAAFVTARFYTADPYYAPTLRRYSDGGLVAPVWVFALATLAVLACLIAARQPSSAQH